MFVFKHFISVVIKKNIFTYKIFVKADTSYLDTESLQKLNTKTLFLLVCSLESMPLKPSRVLANALSRILIYVRTKYF